MTDFTVVIVNFNASHYLPRCFASLGDASIILVDNFSSAQERDRVRMLASSDSRVTLLEQPNRGFAAGVNTAVEHADPSHDIILLNPDAYFSEGSVAELVEEARLRCAAIAVPVIRDHNSKAIWYAGGKLTPTLRAVHYGIGTDRFAPPATCTFATGCVVYISSAAWSHIGPWREDLFLYGEDVDFSLRASRLGYVVEIIDTSIAWHEAGSTTGADAATPSPVAAYYDTRNRFLQLIELKGPLAQVLFPLLAVRTILWYVWRRRELPLKHIAAVLAGTFDAISRLYGPRDVASQSPKKLRVAFCNNYSMTTVARRVADGTMPAQHLWGKYHLDSSHTWTTVCGTTEGGRLSAALLPVLGDLRAQVFIFLRARQFDLVYAADQQSMALLSRLRRRKLFRVPIVVFVHNGPRGQRLGKWLYGTDALLVFSETLAERLNARYPGLRERTHVVGWGVEPDSAIYHRPNNISANFDVIAAGKTNRDIPLLMAALNVAKLSARIHAGQYSMTIRNGVPGDREAPLDYPAIVDEMKCARVVAVALSDPSRVSGLTEVMDALAVLKPVVATRTGLAPYEAEGCSYPWLTTVPSGDVEAMARSLANPPSEPTEVPDELSLETFSAKLDAVFHYVVRSRHER